jgi:hypothetical protein
MMISPRKAWGSAAAGLASVVVVAGCSAGGPGTRAVPVATPVPTPAPASVAQLQLPIAAYELTDQESAEEDYLSQRLTQVCMRQLGFRYLPGLSAGDIADDVRTERELDSRRYGVTDLAVVRADGYHLPPWTLGAWPPPRLNTLPHAEQAALLGPGTGPGGESSGAAVNSYSRANLPPGGCLGWSQSELAAAGVNVQESSDSELAAQIQQDAFEKAQSDPRVRAVFAKWSACMRSHGYDYSTPFKAAGDPRWNMTAPASRSEIKTAETDVACKLQTNVLGVDFAVESDYENTAIAENAGALAQAKADNNIQARGLNRLLAKYRN